MRMAGQFEGLVSCIKMSVRSFPGLKSGPANRGKGYWTNGTKTSVEIGVRLTNI